MNKEDSVVRELKNEGQTGYKTGLKKLIIAYKRLLSVKT